MNHYSYERHPVATLTDALQNETVDTLKGLAALLGDKRPTRKADLIEFIRNHIADDRLRTLWEQLDPLQRAAVAETVHGADPYFHDDRFVAKYGKQPDWGSVDGYGYNRSPSLLALFFYRGVMPQDLRQRLKAFVPPPQPTELKSQDDMPAVHEQTLQVWDRGSRRFQQRTFQTPITRCETEQAALHDVMAVLRLIEAGKLAISDKTAQAGAAGLKAIDAVLLGGDFYDEKRLAAHEVAIQGEPVGAIKAFAWPLLVQAGGLAEPSGKRLQLTAAGRKALATAPERVIAGLWKRWLKTTLLDELRRIDCIKGQTGKGKRSLTAVAGRRAVVQQALKHCLPGRWVAVNDLFRYMRASDLSFEVTRDPWSLHITDAHYGSLGYEGHHDWRILQGRYALCLLFEYAATLGLIDVAYIPPHQAREDYRHMWGTDDLAFLSRYDGLLYLRLNPLGAYCLGLAERYEPALAASQSVLRVLPNREVVAAGGSLAPADRLLLESFAERVSDAVWRLDQGKLLEAQEAGLKVADLRVLLETRSGAPLPDTVAHFLEDMIKRARSLQDKGAARLIECADPALAALIANDSRTKPYCLLATERYLVVPGGSEARFRSALRKLGYSLPQ